MPSLAAPVSIDAGGVETVNGGGGGTQASPWIIGDDLTVGDIGTGTLNVVNGGTVSNTVGNLGSGAGSTGTATVTDVGSTWTNSGNLFVGISGTGTLNVVNGGAVSNTGGSLAFNIGSAGTVTVTGVGSSWTNSSGVSVGRAGDGTLNILNGGTVSSPVGDLGSNTGSTGTAIVSGAGSNWTNTHNFAVGSSGAGALTIEDGGAASSRDGFVGYSTGGSGTVTVTGAGSSWTNTNRLTVGRAGDGTLNVLNGGTVSNVDGYVGDVAGSAGTASVTGVGSSWTNSGQLFVGNSGTGMLTISDGGAVSNTAGLLGFGADAAGTVTVTGSGSSWINSNVLVVGFNGTGVLHILDGSTVSSLLGLVGGLSSSNSTAIVSAAGSNWTITQHLSVGSNGPGTLTVEDGGTVSNVNGIIGGATGVTGTATVTGTGSSWVNTGRLTVGTLGGGTLNVLNGGTVSNADGTVGDVAGSTGTVSVTGVGSTWTNSGELVVGKSGSGILTLADGATVSVNGGAGTAKVAELTGSMGTLNVGAAAGGVAAAAGTLNAAEVRFGAGTGRLVFNHTDADYSFGADISGAGSVDVRSGTTLLTGTNSYAGGTTIQGGVLRVNGSITGITTILNDGILGGSGTLGDVVVSSGGSLAPGNSIGILSVANATFAAGSSYNVEIDNAGGSDLVDATGTVTLQNGVSMNVTSFPAGDDGSTYDLQTDYTVITAAGGVIGTFDSVTENFAFLDAALSYDANNVLLRMTRNATTFNSLSNNINQRNTADGIESLGLGNTVYDATVSLSVDAARAAFDQLSGEQHASLSGMLMEDSRLTRFAAHNRLGNAFGRTEVSPENAQAAAVATSGVSAGVVLANSQDPVLWSEALGSWQTRSANGINHAVERAMGGLMFGMDVRGSEEWSLESWRFGGLAAYRDARVESSTLNSSADVKSVTLGAYGGTRMEDGLGISFGGDYSWHSLKTSRAVNAAGFTDRINAGYDAQTAQVYGEVNYLFEIDRASLEPYAGFTTVYHRTDGFQESGGATALSAQASSSTTALTQLGVRGETILEGAINLYGALAWHHNLSRSNPSTNLMFAGGDSFTIYGMPGEQDTAFVETGLKTRLDEASYVALSYTGQFGPDTSDNGLKASFTLWF